MKMRNRAEQNVICQIWRERHFREGQSGEAVHSAMQLPLLILLVAASTCTEAYVVTPQFCVSPSAVVRAQAPRGLRGSGIQGMGSEVPSSRQKRRSMLHYLTGSLSNTPEGSMDLGFSFSVAGLLFPYHLGAATALREEGMLVKGSPLAGEAWCTD